MNSEGLIKHVWVCRILDEAGLCPICRRKIKKVRKIFTIWVPWGEKQILLTEKVETTHYIGIKIWVWSFYFCQIKWKLTVSVHLVARHSETSNVHILLIRVFCFCFESLHRGGRLCPLVCHYYDSARRIVYLNLNSLVLSISVALRCDSSDHACNCCFLSITISESLLF